jgi:hypothetical protein
MIFGFETKDTHAATGALLVYAVYRSRDTARFKSTPDMWDRIERYTKNAAKRAKTLPEFIEALKPRLICGALKPRWLEVGTKGTVPMITIQNEAGGIKEFIQPAPDRDAREFMTGVIEDANAREVMGKLYRETTWIILLVRNRLEGEKPVEAMLDKLEVHDAT